MQCTLDWMDWAYHRNSEMLRCSIHVHTYLCGLAVVLMTAQFSETSHCHFGLIGLCGTAGVPTVPCWCCLRKEKRFPHFWPSDVSWWRMGVSGPLRWRKLPGCMLIVVGSSLSLGDGSSSSSSPCTTCCVVMWSPYEYTDPILSPPHQLPWCL